MRVPSLILSALALASLSATAAGDKIAWLRLDQAMQAAQSSGKPVLAFSMCANATAAQSGEGACPSCPMQAAETQGAFEKESVVKASQDFIMAKVTDKKTADSLKMGWGEAVFLDPDGEVIHRSMIRSESCVESAMKATLEKYAAREIAWACDVDSAMKTALEEKKPVVLAFLEEGQKTSKALVETLQAPSMARLHDRAIFVQLPFSKDCPVCQAWKVSAGASLVLLSSERSGSAKDIAQRLSGKTDLVSVRSFLSKGLAQFAKLQK